MTSNDLEVGAFFTTNGKDIWKLESYYETPSCSLKNLETGEIADFGMGGLTAQDFHKIQMPKGEQCQTQKDTFIQVYSYAYCLVWQCL